MRSGSMERAIFSGMPTASPSAPRATASAYQRLVPASGGGTYIVWADTRYGYEDSYVQWIDPDGAPVWASDGLAFCEDAYYRYSPELADDGSGGVIVTWFENRMGDAYDLYAGRFDSDGNRVWGPYGKLIMPSYSWESEPSMISDGFGGAIVAADIYPDDVSLTDIYAQRVDHDGNLLWGPKGAAVCRASDYQYAPVLVSDGFGGTIIAWEDYRPETGGNGDIYCQRISALGLWGNPEPEIALVPGCARRPGWLGANQNESLVARRGGRDPTARSSGTTSGE